MEPDMEPSEPDNPKTAKRRGRKPSEAPDKVEAALLKYRNRIVCEGKIATKTNVIWTEIKEKENLVISPNGLYTFVVCNRGPSGILYELGLMKRLAPLAQPDSDLESNCQMASEESSESEDSDLDLGTDNPNLVRSTRRKLFIPKEKWSVIKPSSRDYKDGSTARGYNVLTPGVWSDVLNHQIQKETRLPCSWSFKKHYIARTDEAPFYMKTKGRCACGGCAFLSCTNPVQKDPDVHGLTLDLIIKNAKNEPHKKKRPVTGQRREDLAKNMIEGKTTASRLRKSIAATNSQLFEVESALTPRLNTLRKIKSESVSKQKLAPNAIEAINILKYSPKYKECIFDLGHNPFFVHYLLPEQVRVYNAYASSDYARVVIDASGKIVPRLPRPIGMSGHIFLYEIVIALPGEHEGQIPVAQMLSERQTTIAIETWLKEWLRLGAKPPKEAVIDFSPALVAALCDAFNKVTSREHYLDVCFKYIKDQENNPAPDILIRIDVAHLINMCSKWKCVKAMRKRSKEFYMRSIYLLIQSTSLSDVEHLIQSIFIVASNETEGVSLRTGEETPCDRAKKYLLKRIGEERCKIEAAEKFLTEEGGQGSVDEDDPSTAWEGPASPILKEWLDELYRTSSSPANVVTDGDRDNVAYSPDFRKTFLDLCYKLPLWTNLLAHLKRSPHVMAVGAAVESQFNDLKNRLIKDALQVDLFVQTHVDVLRDTMVLASGLEYFHRKTEVDETHETTTEAGNGETYETPDNENGETVGFDEEVPDTFDPAKYSFSKTCFKCKKGELPDATCGDIPCIQCERLCHNIEECCKLHIRPDENTQEYFSVKCLECHLANPSTADLSDGNNNEITNAGAEGGKVSPAANLQENVTPALTGLVDMPSALESRSSEQMFPPAHDNLKDRITSSFFQLVNKSFAPDATVTNRNKVEEEDSAKLTNKSSIFNSKMPGMKTNKIFQIPESRSMDQLFRPADINLMDQITSSSAEQSNRPSPQASSSGSCFACARGDYPGGAHLCAVCKKAVHVFEGSCSVPAPESEEGYGEVRWCLSCSKTTGTRVPLSSVSKASAFVPFVYEGEKECPASNLKENTAPSLSDLVDTPSALDGSRGSNDHRQNGTAPQSGSPVFKTKQRPMRHPLRKESKAKDNADHCVLCETQHDKDSKCGKCRKALHTIDTCSTLVPGNDGVRNNVRMCGDCTENLPSKSMLELSQVENWGGQALARPRRRGASYYNTPYPELGLRMANEFTSKLEVLQNGGNVRLRPKRVDGKIVSLSNTCGVDALIHLTAVAFCDSPEFREYVNGSASPFLQLSALLAKEGTNKATYQSRSELLFREFQENLRPSLFGVVNIDCAHTPSALLQKLSCPPSLVDTTVCDSPQCPAQLLERKISVLTTNPDVLREGGIKSLQRALASTDLDTEQYSPCLSPVSNLNEGQMEPELVTNVPRNRRVSAFALCNGIRSHTLAVSEGIFVAVVGKQDSAIEFPVKCRLQEIPTQIEIMLITYHLRGAVGVTLPKQDNLSIDSLSHFTAYVRRIGGKWYVFDDLKKKPAPVKEETVAHIDMLFYTKH